MYDALLHLHRALDIYEHQQTLALRVSKQLVVLTLILLLGAHAANATTLVVQKEISVSRALAGQVLVKGTDELADGVTVELRSSDWKDVLASTKTDAKGHFSFRMGKTTGMSTTPRTG